MSFELPLTIYCDNEAAILVATNNASRKRARYLSQAFYVVNDFVWQENINIQWTSSATQRADIMTKALGPSKHSIGAMGIGIGKGHNCGRGC